MSNSDQLIHYLKSVNQSICDDCLSLQFGFNHRQQVNQMCNKLYKNRLLVRIKSICFSCQCYKITNSINSTITNNTVSLPVKKKLPS